MKFRQLRSRTGSALPFILMGVVAVLLVFAGGYMLMTSSEDSDIIEPIFVPVERGEFVSQVLDQGEVQSSENVEIRCEVRARNGELSVLTVVPEGTMVKPGDFLVQLDSTAFEKELEAQQVALVNAQTRVIQAKSTLDSAEATLEEYIKGTFEQEKLTIKNEIADADGAIVAAEQKIEQSQETLGYSEKLQAKGYLTRQSLETARFELERAKIDLGKGQNSLKLAKKKLDVLENITFRKNEIQYQADIEAAKVQLDSEKKALKVEEETLAEVEEMIAKCEIKVPEGVSGQVVYAKESSRGGNDWVLEEGTTVRQNQVLIRLPNPDKMEVKALINEQSITQVEPNMPCTIKVDALNDTTLKGVVTKVNQYAESSGWMSTSVRKYAVFVKILDPPKALKPGMNASVTIQVQYKPDVLLTPLQAVYAVQDKKFVLLRDGDGWETREVKTGGDNSQMVYITEGVEEGEQLVMNPGAYKDVMDLPEMELEKKIEIPEGEQVAVKERGPGGPGEDGPSDGAGGGRRGPGGGGMGGMQVPESGAALISDKDSDGDGKLTKDEAGQPFSFFFDRVDTDGDGFLSESEADASIKRMKQMMQNRGGGGGGGFGRGGGRQE